MKFVLATFVTIALFATIKSLNESEDKRLADLINLIWPVDGIIKPDGSMVPDNEPINSKSNGDVKCNGKCVPYILCKKETSCTTGDCIEIDIGNNDGPCGDNLTVCCKDSNIVAIKSAPPSSSINNGCGMRNKKGAGFRITGDTKNEAQFGEFPWMVAILQKEDSDVSNLLSYECGGSLIHPKVVLTSTHCVLSDDEKYYVRAGEWDTQTESELLPHQERIVVNIIPHPEYNSGLKVNDIALLILETPFNLAGNVQTVCLPPADEILQNTRCFASGWGKTNYEKAGERQVILKKIELPIVQNDLCQEQLRKTRLGNRFTLHKSVICAGGEKGIDTCDGDGGSPLVCPIPGKTNRYYQGGIVSWGIDCGLENVPGLYANVPLFRNWVDDEMFKHGFNETYYTY